MYFPSTLSLLMMFSMLVFALASSAAASKRVRYYKEVGTIPPPRQHQHQDQIRRRNFFAPIREIMDRTKDEEIRQVQGKKPRDFPPIFFIYFL